MIPALMPENVGEIVPHFFSCLGQVFESKFRLKTQTEYMPSDLGLNPTFINDWLCKVRQVAYAVES